MIIVSIRVYDPVTGAPVTGLTSSNIVFRKSPYGTGDVISGLTVSEIGSQGNYVISGFVSWQKTKLYINGILQQWWGEQYTGDEDQHFVNTSSAQNVGGQKTFTGSNLHSGNNSFTGSNTYSGTETFTGSAEFDGSVVFVNGQQVSMLGDTTLRNAVAADPNMVPSSNSFIWKSFADAAYLGVSANRIVVDSKAPAEVNGKLYRSIRAAINYAYNYGSPAALNRWEILVLPHESGVYTEDFYWYDYIDIIGIGWVKIRNSATKSVFIRSGVMGDRNVKASNLHFECTDTDLNFKKMIMDNCSAVMIEDNLPPTLTLEDSQFRNCYFGKIGSSVIVPAGSNRVINCGGGVNIAWNINDKLYNWAYLDGDYIQQ